MKNDYSFLGEAKTVAVVCNQWGDTGKGKIVDFLTPWADIVARGTGGANAGHTIAWEGKLFVTHLLPSSIFHDKEGKISVIGSGVVFDPRQCIAELLALHANGYSSENLRISRRAKLVLPQHIVLDRLSASRVNESLGTTGRGIGPAYSDYYNRNALTVGDLFHRDTFAKKLQRNIEEKTARIREYDPALVKEILFHKHLGEGIFFSDDDVFNRDSIVDHFTGEYADTLRDYVTDTDALIRSTQGKKHILLEGAQGYLLSIDYGTYPYVTSSDPSLDGLAKGVGLRVQDVDLTFGVLKGFYMTRVGKGAFPTEMGGEKSEEHCGKTTKDEELKVYANCSVNEKDDFKQGIAIRINGNEYGATTGRLRRTGWLDLPMLRQALHVNGNDVILTKLDVLDECDEIKICTSYRYIGEAFFLGRDTLSHGAILNSVFPDNALLRSCEPIYKIFPGWKKKTSNMRSYEDLPQEMKTIIGFIEKETGACVRMISVGPERDQTIIVTQQ